MAPPTYDADDHWDDDSLVWDDDGPQGATNTMKTDRRTYRFPDSKLFEENLLITNAATGDTDVEARLPAGFVAETVTKRGEAETALSGRAEDSGDLADLTDEQKSAYDSIVVLMAKARKTAKLAFQGQKTKLSEEFTVGNKDGKGLSAVKTNAGIIAASCAITANATALAAKGWTAGDTTTLNDAITALGGADSTQEIQKGTNKGDSQTLYGMLNDLYERTLAIQNAADIEYPAGSPANTVKRNAYRLDGLFPPPVPKKKKTTPPPPTPPTP